MLPNSRNQTVDTISPLEAATINDLQDCIVGAKHGASSVLVHASAFNTLGQSGFSWNLGSLVWQLDDRLAWASVPVPPGARITEIDWVVNKNSLAAGMVLSVVGKRFGSPVAGLSITGSDASAGSGHHVVSYAGSFDVPANGTSIYLVAGFFSGAGTVVGIELESATVKFSRL